MLFVLPGMQQKDKLSAIVEAVWWDLSQDSARKPFCCEENRVCSDVELLPANSVFQSGQPVGKWQCIAPFVCIRAKFQLVGFYKILQRLNVIVFPAKKTKNTQNDATTW